MIKKESSVKSLTAYNLILGMIFSGEALPGNRLVLADLEQKLGLGRGPLREALIQLDKAGLVKNIPYKGAIVSSPPSYQEMEFVYTLRVFAEVSLASVAVRKITDDDVEVLTSIVQRMHEINSEEINFFKIEREFYNTLYNIADMPHLHSLVENMLNYVEIFLISKTYEPHDRRLYIGHYTKIIEALQSRNKEKLCAALESNIILGLDAINKEIQRYKNKTEKMDI